jgi:colicin import membrane protein
MAANNEQHGLVSALTSGVKDMPRNASWLIGKALRVGDPPGQGSEGNGAHREGSSALMGAVRSASATVRDALPGGDSVEARLDRARVAADRAHEAETDALRAAEYAAELSSRAEQIDQQEQARVAQLEDEQAEAVRRQVEDARARADEQVAKEQHEAELEAHDVLSREREASDARAKDARDAAEAAQQDAEERLSRATEQLSEARSLADEAARAAEEAAANARAQAEQIAENARRDAASTGAAVDRAVKLQQRSSRTAGKVARAIDDKSTPGRLKELPKSELVKLASAQGITGRSAMSKTQLVTALDKGKKGARR